MPSSITPNCIDGLGDFMMNEMMAITSLSSSSSSCSAIQPWLFVGLGIIEGVPVLLAKPQKHMNLSGESVGPLAAYYKLPLIRVLVAFDDRDLPCGVLRLQPKGGYGHHNGIGWPPGQMDPKAFVLQKFNKTSREQVNIWASTCSFVSFLFFLS
uniref:Uncharacterized protein n=1 Tax=Oryza punctata TaxID=4537 RepID=A0A0E0L6N6_ORYPU